MVSIEGVLNMNSYQKTLLALSLMFFLCSEVFSNPAVRISTNLSRTSLPTNHVSLLSQSPKYSAEALLHLYKNGKLSSSYLYRLQKQKDFTKLDWMEDEIVQDQLLLKSSDEMEFERAVLQHQMATVGLQYVYEPIKKRFVKMLLARGFSDEIANEAFAISMFNLEGKRLSGAPFTPDNPIGAMNQIGYRTALKLTYEDHAVKPKFQDSYEMYVDINQANIGNPERELSFYDQQECLDFLSKKLNSKELLVLRTIRLDHDSMEVAIALTGLPKSTFYEKLEKVKKVTSQCFS
jgi:hypothetical protein